jgi:hypothetical protein
LAIGVHIKICRGFRNSHSRTFQFSDSFRKIQQKFINIQQHSARFIKSSESFRKFQKVSVVISDSFSINSPVAVHYHNFCRAARFLFVAAALLCFEKTSCASNLQSLLATSNTDPRALRSSIVFVEASPPGQYRDLEIRGAGGLLETEQSDIAANVGLDLYKQYSSYRSQREKSRI